MASAPPQSSPSNLELLERQPEPFHRQNSGAAKGHVPQDLPGPRPGSAGYQPGLKYPRSPRSVGEASRKLPDNVVYSRIGVTVEGEHEPSAQCGNPKGSSSRALFGHPASTAVGRQLVPEPSPANEKPASTNESLPPGSSRSMRSSSGRLQSPLRSVSRKRLEDLPSGACVGSSSGRQRGKEQPNGECVLLLKSLLSMENLAENLDFLLEVYWILKTGLRRVGKGAGFWNLSPELQEDARQCLKDTQEKLESAVRDALERVPVVHAGMLSTGGDQQQRGTNGGVSGALGVHESGGRCSAQRQPLSTSPAASNENSGPSSSSQAQPTPRVAGSGAVPAVDASDDGDFSFSLALRSDRPQVGVVEETATFQPSGCSSGSSTITLEACSSSASACDSSLVLDPGHGVKERPLSTVSSSGNPNPKETRPELLVPNTTQLWVSAEDLHWLRRLVQTLQDAGLERECLKLYKDTRKQMLTSALAAWGVGQKSAEEAHCLCWEELKGDVDSWAQGLSLVLRSVLPAERQLAQRCLGVTQLADDAFLDLGDLALSVLKDSAEKLCGATNRMGSLHGSLDLYEASLDSDLFAEELFSGALYKSLKLKAEGLQQRNRVAVKKGLEVFESILAVKVPEDIPPNACYSRDGLLWCAMDQLQHYSRYTVTLEAVLGREALKVTVESVLRNMAKHIEKQALACSSPAKAEFYKMSCIWFMVTQVKGMPLHDILDSRWSAKLQQQIHEHMRKYIHCAWGPVSKILSTSQADMELSSPDKTKVGGRSGSGQWSSKLLASITGRRSFGPTTAWQLARVFSEEFRGVHAEQRQWLLPHDVLRRKLYVGLEQCLKGPYEDLLRRFSLAEEKEFNQGERILRHGEITGLVQELFKGDETVPALFGDCNAVEPAFDVESSMPNLKDSISYV